jgi:hypothetical protein
LTCRTIYSEALPIASKNLLVNFSTEAPFKFFSSRSAIQKRGVIKMFDCITNVSFARCGIKGIGFINYFPRLKEVHLKRFAPMLYGGQWSVSQVFGNKNDALSYCNGKDWEARDQRVKQDASLAVSRIHPFTTRALALPDSDFRIILRVLVDVVLHYDYKSPLSWLERLTGELVS